MNSYYHIFSRGNNRQNIYIETRNYDYFMKLYRKFIDPVAETFAYCMLRNHFHLLIRTRTAEEQEQIFLTEQIPSKYVTSFQVRDPSRQFGNLFNAYAKAINKAYGLTGSLFQHPFGRTVVAANSHFMRLIIYIHFNPQKHGFVEDFRDWPFSSYRALISETPTHLARDEVREWFGNLDSFLSDHDQLYNHKEIADIIFDDNDDRKP